ncbi:glutathione S-transferase [Cognatishimia sp. WU-CL00825]|uniref:glutathione S-transferase family protein n=1 Tax=Cognatishimia sp. WU-CL00825 TaxID=3127658 RepID=UPI0031060315
MKLITAGASPFGRKVKVALIETGQLQDVEIVAVKTTATAVDPIVQAANPMGKIPALLRPDAPALYDSRVICRFLDARAKAGLYPEQRLWDVLTLEATADAILDAAVLITYEGRLRPKAQQSTAWTDAQWSKVSKGVAALNTKWMSHLNGRLDMGQIAVGCALGYLDFRHDARNWRKGNDTLAKWFETFSNRTSMQATLPSDA